MIDQDLIQIPKYRIYGENEMGVSVISKNTQYNFVIKGFTGMFEPPDETDHQPCVNTKKGMLQRNVQLQHGRLRKDYKPLTVFEEVK